MPRIVDGPFLGDPLLPFGRGGVGAFEGQLQRADQPAELAEPVVAEAEVFLVDDVDLAAPDDRRLVDRFEVVLAEVGLERDVDRLGQVLQRGLDADLPRVDLQGHVAQAARLPRRDRAAVARTRRDRHADGEVGRGGQATVAVAAGRAGAGRGQRAARAISVPCGGETGAAGRAASIRAWKTDRARGDSLSRGWRGVSAHLKEFHAVAQRLVLRQQTDKIKWCPVTVSSAVSLPP